MTSKHYFECGFVREQSLENLFDIIYDRVGELRHVILNYPNMILFLSKQGLHKKFQFTQILLSACDPNIYDITYYQ